jgi:amino acid permease
MIGGLILVLPLYARQAGTVLSFLVIFGAGFFSFYSCHLCLKHLGKSKDLDQSILEHFGRKWVIKAGYDLLVFVNLMFILMLYFNFIVAQWSGLLGFIGVGVDETSRIVNVVCNAFVLVFLTIGLSYLHLGVSILGIGVISVIGYCIFLTWLISTAPTGDNKIAMFGVGAPSLAASMGLAFSIQTFFIPVLREMQDYRKYERYTLIAYVVGGSIYMYIAFAGSFGIYIIIKGILNR